MRALALGLSVLTFAGANGAAQSARPTIAPLPIPNGTGSPVNPIASF
jgi:hypothetical protein